MSDVKLLSVCCGANPLDEIHDGIGICAECRDNTTFSNEVFFEDKYYDETGYHALGYRSGGLKNPTNEYVAWLIGIIAESQEALMLACNDIWILNGGEKMPVSYIEKYNKQAKDNLK